MKHDKPIAEIECDIVRETDAAICITFDDSDHWIPLSQVTEIHRNTKGVDKIVMYEWIAIEKGLV